MSGHSALTRGLIMDGLRQPASAEPLTDALAAATAASKALTDAATYPPGTGRDLCLSLAREHLVNAQHAVSAAQVRSERAA